MGQRVCVHKVCLCQIMGFPLYPLLVLPHVPSSWCLVTLTGVNPTAKERHGAQATRSSLYKYGVRTALTLGLDADKTPMRSRTPDWWWAAPWGESAARSKATPPHINSASPSFSSLVAVPALIAASLMFIRLARLPVPRSLCSTSGSLHCALHRKDPFRLYV